MKQPLKIRAIRLVGMISVAVCLMMVQAVIAQTTNAATTPPSVNPAVSPAVCQAGCECMTDAMAAATFGSYLRCSNTVCGYETTSAMVQYAAKELPVNTAKYCVRKNTAAATPDAICPANCMCLPETDAKAKGYVPCNGVQHVCGYQSLTGTSAETSRTQPLYCYGKPVSSGCPFGCSCMTEEAAKEKFGSASRCSNAPCMNAMAADSAQVSYCFRQTGTPQVEVSQKKPVRCTCTCQQRAGTATTDTGSTMTKEKEACTCRCDGESTQSGTSTAPVVIGSGSAPCTDTYCTSCAYDSKLTACTGSCKEPGAVCQINTLTNNADGTVASAQCHCKQPAGSVPQAATTPYVIAASCNTTAGICQTSEGVQVPVVSFEPAGEVKPVEKKIVPNAVRSVDTAGKAGEPAASPEVSPLMSMKNEEPGNERPDIQATPDIVRSIGNIIRSFFGFAGNQ